MLDHVKVDSSNIESIAHDGSVLEVKFKGGAVYRYDGVPPATHAALMAASSKGAHFAKHIRPKFKAAKVSP